VKEWLISLPDLLSNLHRTVVLGNPGGGKSTLTNKICYDFSKASNEDPSRVTPIPVILREYGSEKKAHNYSIVDFIEATAADKYQITPPPGAVEYLLLNGRAAVIFDGLDELLETAYRQEIRDDIESFCNRFPSAPVVVTSREVGYEQAPLSGDKFETYRLAPFNEEQVSEYVRKWFDTRLEYTPAQGLGRVTLRPLRARRRCRTQTPASHARRRGHRRPAFA
jgi:predicted NACHT family NTPase